MHSYKDLEAPARHNQTLLSVLLLATLDIHGGCIEHRLGHEERGRHVLLIEDTWTSDGNAQ